MNFVYKVDHHNNNKKRLMKLYSAQEVCVHVLCTVCHGIEKQTKLALIRKESVSIYFDK